MKNPFTKLLSWYFKRNSLPYWCIIILDCAIFFFAGVLVYFMSHRLLQTAIHLRSLTHVLLIFMMVCIVSFRIFHTYSGIVRYSSFVDLQRVAYANSLAMIVCVILRYTFFTHPTKTFAYISGWQIILIFIIATLVSGGMRVLVKVMYDIVTSDRKAMRVLVYGTQEGGIAVAKSIRAQRPMRFLLRGFISHVEGFSNHQLMGERVINSIEDIEQAIKKLKIEAVLVSPLRSEEFRNDQKLQDILIEAGVKIYMVGNALEWDGKTPFMGQMLMTEVEVEDLLPRDKITVDLQNIGRQLHDKRVLITGAAGSIGSEMVRQLATFKPVAMMLIDQAETPLHDIRLMMARDWPEVKAETIVTSICNKDRMETIFSEFRPDYVFHAAAYKHVPMMEDNPSEAVQNNIFGTKVLADVSVKNGVEKFVMVSTDKAVNPTNVMGCSKRICEIYVQSLNDYVRNSKSPNVNTQFVTTRFGNVLGSNGSVIPLFREQIKKGGPVTVTHPDIIRYFMLIPEACQLVLEAGVKGNGGEIFVFDMGKPVRIADLAQRMIRLSGAHNVEVKFTGLRAGEKLYEEVLSDKENTKPSFHEKIRIAEVRKYDFDQVSRNIDDLIALSCSNDAMAIVKKMKQIVPEYKSQNSVYTQLDAPQQAQ